MSADATPARNNDPVVPYQAWWGLAGCGLIIGVICLIMRPFIWSGCQVAGIRTGV